MAHKIKKINTDLQFTETYRSLYPFILRYCIAKLRGSVEDAEECAQEAFFILYKRYCNNETVENPRAFLIKTVNNIVMKKGSLMSKNTYSLEEYKEQLETKESPQSYSDIEYTELLGLIESKLEEPDKTIFNLRYVEDKSIKEISEITGISITNITTRISRFRNKVQQEINKWRGVK